MRTSAIVCAVLAGSLGLGSATSAFAGRDDRGDRRESRQERREDRREMRQERREARHERREDRREARHERREDRRDWRQHQQQHRWAAQQPRYYQPPRYVVQQPRYVYSQPARYYRGGYLPYEYRQPAYYVNDWQSVHGLYAPPSGHQWMHVGNDFLLVAITTGLIAGLLSGM